MTRTAAILITLASGVCRIEAAAPRSTTTAPSDLPIAVLEELQSRGCKMPGKKSRGQVIHGDFLGLGQSDWAALCSTKKGTTLLLFPDGPREGVVALEAMQKTFSKWSIGVIDRDQLTLWKPALGWHGPAPAEIGHQGIMSFIEWGDKDAGCFYCYSAQNTLHYHYQHDWLNVVTEIDN